MSETKWTEGPWAVDPDDRPGMEWNNFIVVAGDPDMRICFMAHGDTDEEENEANANLIAAAPDLYEALMKALTYHSKSLALPHPVLMACDAALALARGEKPWAFNIDRFSAGLDELSRKDQRNPLKVLAVLAQAKRFSVFEATENDVIAATMTTVMKSGWVADVGGGYPWTNIELTDAGREALGHGEKP